MNIKDYKLKRPKKGYNTEKERQFSAWSDVSDWELYYKNQLIGTVYFIGTLMTQWGGTLDVNNFQISERTKKEVFYQLANEHYRFLERKTNA